MSAQQLIFSNLLFYLLGFVTLLSVRKYISEQSVSLFSLLISLIGVLMSLGLSVVGDGKGFSFEWFSIGRTTLSVDVLLNNLTLLMYFIVQFVGFWVQVFSVKYMENDSDFVRYYAYLNLFIFSMLGLVVSGNLLQVYMFWELVGFCSYLLIGFWYQRSSATNAAKKAFLVNRIGDVGFLLGIIMAYGFFNTLNISDIALKSSQIFADFDIYSASKQFSKGSYLTVMGLLLFCGCVAKSAQFPLQIWLPDAMQGPTPVSALIHAATMVAAGIFLMARITNLITPTAGFVIASVGVVTTLMAAYSAIFQYDIKKVLAYSTVSQLGLMVVGVGVGATNAALFHLTTHAFFKAGLFLCAGAVIHHLHHEQDIRKMGNLRQQMPIVFWAFGICSAALAGLPFFSGFLSKDAILIAAFDWADKQNNDLFFLIPMGAVFASAMTAYYIVRLYIIAFFDREGSTTRAIIESTKKTYQGIRKGMKAVVSADEMGIAEQDIYSFIRSIGPMETAVMVMALGSFFLPFSANPFDAVNSNFVTSFPMNMASEYHWISYAMALITLISIWMSYIFTKEEVGRVLKGVAVYEKQNWIARLAENHFYLNELYHIVFIEPLVKLSAYIQRVIDVSLIDAAVNGFAKLAIIAASAISHVESSIVDKSVRLIAQATDDLGSQTRKIQGGKVQSHVIALFLGLLLLIFMVFVLK